MFAHVTDWYPQHPARPETLIGPDLVTELDILKSNHKSRPLKVSLFWIHDQYYPISNQRSVCYLNGDVVAKTQPCQGLTLCDCVVQEAAPVAAGAGARAITLPRVSVLKQEPLTRSPEAEKTVQKILRGMFLFCLSSKV